jgi:ankyrin repeat protein
MTATKLAAEPTDQKANSALNSKARAWIDKILPLLDGLRNAGAGVGNNLPQTPSIPLAQPPSSPTATGGSAQMAQPVTVSDIDALVKALETNDEPLVQQLVQRFVARGDSFDAQATSGEIPLTQAIKADPSKRIIFTELLLNNGAGLDFTNTGKETALIIAAQVDDAAITDLLLRKGASIDLQELQHKTALYTAVEKGHANVIARLLKSSSPSGVDIAADGGRTPLMEAASKGDLTTVTLLHASKANLEEKDNRKRTALMFASDGGHSNVVKYLVSKRVNPHGVDDDGRNALMGAAMAGNADIAKSLLTGDRKVFVNVADNDNKTALMHAVKVKHSKDKAEVKKNIQAKNAFITELVKNPDLDVNVKDTINQSNALIDAAEFGDAKTLELVLNTEKTTKKKVQVDEINKKGMTALLNAAAPGRPHDLVRLLINAKVKNVDVKEPTEGNTALILAVQNLNVDGVKALLGAKADANIKNANGDTALAVAQGLQKIGNPDDEKALQAIIAVLKPKTKP